jgi:microcystin-dependent protein
MAEPFTSEIRIMSFGYAPRGWAMCNGQLLPINQNQALFSLLGTTFGGNGQTTFGLPDLRGQTPIHVGNGHTLGEKGGVQAVTLSIAQIPTHTHTANASTTQANQATLLTNSQPNILAAVTGNQYAPASNPTTLVPDTVTNTGGSQAHQNMQPFLTLTFCIALQGIFPSPN